jgi:hypothetical protein
MQPGARAATRITVACYVAWQAQAVGKKIPACRRANDTLFNVSERSANKTV